MSDPASTRMTEDVPARIDGFPISLVSEGHKVPFSKGLLATTLTATGLAPDRFNPSCWDPISAVSSSLTILMTC